MKIPLISVQCLFLAELFPLQIIEYETGNDSHVVITRKGLKVVIWSSKKALFIDTIACSVPKSKWQ